MSTSKSIVDTGEYAVEFALGLIRDRFETGILPDHLHSHNTDHTRGVVDRALLIGVALGLSEVELLLVKIAAAFHDTKQVWDKDLRGEGVTLRKRCAGPNEVMSAHEAVAYMKCQERIQFTPEDYGVVAKAIITTIPGWNMKYGTVTQSFLTPHSDPIARAVALADLGSAGMHTATFLEDGPNLFFEDNLDIVCNLDTLTPIQQQQALERYIRWLEMQSSFVLGRKQYFFEYELRGLTERQRTAVAALFSEFDASHTAAVMAAQAARDMSFEQFAERARRGLRQ